MRYIFLIFILFFIGCNSSHSTSEINDTTDSSNSSIEITNNYKVEVFTIAPVLNALVKDADNQIAIFDKNSSKYIFNSPIKYPISVFPTNDTFIDVDYDKNKSAIDIKPNFNELKSFQNEINLLTNLYYSNEYNDSNISIDEYKNLITNKFNIDIQNSPTQNENVAKVLFATYNRLINDKTLNNLNEIDTYLDKLNLFFQFYLETIDINKTKYYSIYDSLIQLDKKNIYRIDTLHKPNITILRNNINILYKNSSLDIFDIIKNNNIIYTASGHDELGLFDINLNYKNHSNGDLSSFGVSLYKENYNNNQCLFLADSLNGFKTFDISNNTINETTHKKTYYDEKANKYIEFTLKNLLSLNGYVSPQNSKRFLTISTDDNGFYLIDIKNNFTNCNLNQDINSSTMLIRSDGKFSVSSAFRNDGSFLYTSLDGYIVGYDLQSVSLENILASKKTFSLNGEIPYNLKLVNNDNELFVTTNKGIQVFDVDNSNNLTFISKYSTEGAKNDYYPRIDFYNNYLFFTDGYKGLKVIKYDDSFTPMLCGVEYFAPKDNPEELAKVNSVKYYDGYLYVGIDSYGIVKFKFEDILFKHCKE